MAFEGISKRRLANLAGDTGDEAGGGGGGFHLPAIGGTTLLKQLGRIPLSLGRLAFSLLPGGEPAGQAFSRAGKGIGSSILGTAGDIANVGTLGAYGASGLQDTVSGAYAKGFGEQYRPRGFLQKVREEGIVPAAVEDIGNVAAGAAGVRKLAGGFAEGSRAAQVSEALAHPYTSFGRGVIRPLTRAAEADRVASLGESAQAGRDVIDANRAIEGVPKPPKSRPPEEFGTDLPPEELAKMEAPPKVAGPRTLLEEPTNAGKAAEARMEAERVTPEMGTAPRPSPTAEKAAELTKTPIPKWAEGIVARLPEQVTARLSNLEGRLKGSRPIIRDYERLTEAARRNVIHSDAMRSSVDLARGMVGQVLPTGETITRAMANRLVASEIMSRLDATHALERFMEGKGRDSQLVRDVTGREAIPKELLTPELEAGINQAADLWRSQADLKTNTMLGSRLGAKGIETALSGEVPWTKGEQQMLAEAFDHMDEADTARQIAEASQAGLEGAHERLRGLAQRVLGEEAEPRDIIEASTDAQATIRQAERDAEAAFKHADRIEAHAQAQLDRLAFLRDNPSIARMPAQWQPVWDVVKQLTAEAEMHPHMRYMLEGLPKKFSQVLDFATEQGFDPTHVRSFSEAEVRRLTYDAVRLGRPGRGVGKVLEAGTRKARLSPHPRTRSLEALASGVTEVAQEANSNALVDHLENYIARDIPEGGIPKGWAAWEPERTFILTGEKLSDGTQLVNGPNAPTKMIPEAVQRTLTNYTKDYNHAAFKAMAKVTNPWRAFMLTLSPRWYVNNVMGNAILATAEGVRMRDWLAAWKSYKTGYSDVTEAIGGSHIETELGHPDVVPTGRGLGGIKEAMAESGKSATSKAAQATAGVRGVLRQASHRVQRLNTAVDDFARAAVYHKTFRTTGSAEKALMRSYQALVDYGDLSPFQRAAVRAAVPFFSWQKGVLKLVSRLPIDHPVGVAVLMALDDVNKEAGAGLPEAYANIVNLPLLGNLNTRGLNPLQDSDALVSPEGIARSLNPFMEIAARKIMGAPEGGFVRHRRVNELGYAEPTTDPVEDLGAVTRQLPQLRLLSGRGNAAKRAAGFVGLPTYSDDELANFRQRVAKSKAQVAKNAPYPAKDKTRKK